MAQPAPSRPPSTHGARAPIEPRNVRSVRLGQGANCSSIGSVVDTLFATGSLGVALFAMVAAALRSEPITVVGVSGEGSPPGPRPNDPPPVGREPPGALV